MKALLLSLLLLPLVAKGQDVGLPFFAADSTGGACASTNLWTTPVLQQQTNNNSGFNLNSYGSMKIHNWSAETVTIKKFIGYLQSNGSGDATVYALARGGPFPITGGTGYGTNSALVTITNNAPNRAVEFTWADADAPVIPPNTDFHIGMVASVAGRISYKHQTSDTFYEGSSYSLWDGGSQYGYDMAFEIHVCGSGATEAADLSRITMYWDSKLAPQGKVAVWRDLTNNIPIISIYSNYFGMYNTPDGMIMGSGVMSNTGNARLVTAIQLNTNTSVWMTMKRENLGTTRDTVFYRDSDGGIFTYLDWMQLYNFASPSRITPSSNHFIGRWTDIAIAFGSNRTYTVYLDGVYMTNQPSRSGYYPYLYRFGNNYDPNWLQNESRIGQIIVWTNKLLTATEATNLHTWMLTNMVDTPSMSNALPTTTGLRNAWRTAGFIGRWNNTNWTDYVSGNKFTMADPLITDVSGSGHMDQAFAVTGRGMETWFNGSQPLSEWVGGDMVFPATYTYFLTFTPRYAPDTAYLLCTTVGDRLYWEGSSGRVWHTTLGYASGALTMNRTHSVMAVYNGTSTYYYVDGSYYTNYAGGFATKTISSIGNARTYLSSHNYNLTGYIPEFLLYTNTALTNADALAYHTYATNQYGFDWYGVTNTTAVATNAYGYYFMSSTSSIWASPIVQQQINDNNYSQFGKTSWGHQKIKNTSSTETRIKKIRYKFKEAAGVAISAYAFISRTNDGLVSYDLNRTFTATNALSASAPTLWRDFIYSDVDTPIIPANTDFYIFLRFDSAGAGIIEQRLNSIAGGTGYQDTSYAWDQGTSELTPTLDACFQIYACTNEVYVACTSSNVWTSPILQEQLTDNNYGIASASQWSAQYIKNTSSSAVRIKAVRFKLQNRGGATGQNIYAMARNDYYLPNGIEYGGYSRTNVFSGTVSGPAVWETFTWADGTEPLIPASTDFYIGFRSETDSVYYLFQRNIGTGDAYQDGTYCWYTTSGGSGNDDMVFQIYVCP